MQGYEQRKHRLTEEIRSAASGDIRLGKDTSNLFRDRDEGPRRSLDVRDFKHVLAVDPDARVIEVEGMTPYSDLVDATLPHGVMPAVVPQLKSITIGGAVSGIGIESSSFRYGLPHETVLEMDVLLGHGEVVTCSPDNEHRDLFFGFPNSYGTLGYILKLRTLAVPVKPYVHLRHEPFTDPEAFFDTLAERCADDTIDFVDASVFERGRHYLTTGRFVDQAPYTSDYTYLDIYYRSIARTHRGLPQRVRLHLALGHRLVLVLQEPLRPEPPDAAPWSWRRRLSSVTYTKVMRWNSHWGVTRRLNALTGNHPSP